MRFFIPRPIVSAWQALWRRTLWSRRTFQVQALARQLEKRAIALADADVDQRLPEPCALPDLLAHIDELLSTVGDDPMRMSGDLSVRVEDASDASHTLISGIIEIRDSLVKAIRDVVPESRHVIEAIDRKLLRLLRRQNVLPFEQQGPFDSGCHQARGRCETSNPELHDNVAETFRVGYRHGDVLIRPHEVLVYVHHGEG